MADRNKGDFEIHSVTSDDFVVHKVTKAPKNTQEDFIIHQQETARPEAENNEDFEMVTRQTEPILKEMPAITDSLVIGEFNANRIPVFINAETFSEITRHLSSRLHGPNPNSEMAGAPIGRYCIDHQGRKFVEIVAYFPFSTQPTGGRVNIPAEEHIRVREGLYGLMAKGENVNIVAGWIHSHPRMVPAPSDTDITTSHLHYNLDHMSTIIFDPVSKQVGVFEPDGRGGLRNKGGLVVIGRNNQIAKGVSYCHREHF